MELTHRNSQIDPLEASLDAIQPKLRRIFASHRVPHHDAEDLLQQALLSYVYKRESIDNFEHWLLAVVRKRCLMYWRGRRRQLYVAVDTAILDGIAEEGTTAQERSDFRRDLNTALERLPDRCRSLLNLRYGLGCDPADTAERLGYRPSSIYKVLERCLAAVAGRLADAGLTDPCRPGARSAG